MNLVPSDGLEAAWPYVVPGIRVVQQKTGEQWNEHDVHRALISGQAQLFTRAEGFMILQPQRDEWTCKPFIQVWIAWFKPQSAKAIRQELVEWLDQLTNQNWKFNSPRMGWHALEAECEIERIIWRRKNERRKR